MKHSYNTTILWVLGHDWNSDLLMIMDAPPVLPNIELTVLNAPPSNKFHPVELFRPACTNFTLWNSGDNYLPVLYLNGGDHGAAEIGQCVIPSIPPKHTCEFEEFCTVLCENYGGWRWSNLSRFWRILGVLVFGMSVCLYACPCQFRTDLELIE